MPSAQNESTNQAELIDKLVWDGVLKTREIIDAFNKVDRADFILEEYIGEVYEDHPLPIGHEQTISQPTTVALMLELLQPKVDERILDVGSGSGWTTALIAQIVGPGGKVWGVELIPELVEFGKKNLDKYNFPHAEIKQAHSASSGQAEDILGLPSEAPFDKILVSAAGDRFPQELIDQLRVGGRMVIPIRNSIFKIDKISRTETEREEFPGFVFVPLK